MSTVITINPDGSATLDNGSVKRTFRFFDATQGKLGLRVENELGAELGVPHRYKFGGNKICCDYPGVNANEFTTNGNQGGAGTITTG